MRILRLAILLAAIVGLGWNATLTHAESGPSYTLHQIVMVKQNGKADRSCEVIAVDRQPDGHYVYKLKVKENGQILTIHDAPPSTPTPTNTAKAPEVPTPPPAPLATATTKVQRRPLETAPAQTVRSVVPLPAMPWEGSGLSLFPNGTPTTGERPGLARNGRPEPAVLPIIIRRPANPIQEPPILAQMPEIPTLPPIGSTPTIVQTKQEQIDKLGATLRDALLPSHREEAAEQLAESSVASSLAVRSLLMTAAGSDPAGSVRACCIRCLAKIGVRDAGYEALLNAAKNDPHPRVREELQLVQALRRE